MYTCFFCCILRLDRIFFVPISQLPPRNTLNGIIRLAILVYWEKGHPNETSTVKVHNNSTVAILPYLKQNGKYSFRVKVCTLANQCSANSKEGSIEEEVTNMLSRGASKSKLFRKIEYYHLYTVTFKFIFHILCSRGKNWVEVRSGGAGGG